ncbi:MAG: lytic transglycosylase domain-containing protein [Candidatus Calescibacterium sp.]|nr:lytic transglycosylase domain-containing protein [Candidatus Calescibacterium sp.]MDW8086958.1 lytic transglycosylase domain-containing protein [Candidatus Calescibacterium sp.]
MRFLVIVFSIILSLSSFSQKVYSYEEDLDVVENKIAKFAYGLRLLADYEFYDTAIYLLESGVDTSFSEFAKYYTARAYMFLGDLQKAREYFLSIKKDFIWYEYVLQNIYFISFRIGDFSLCNRFNELKVIPERGVPEFYELLFLCNERYIVELLERNKEAEAQKVKERMKNILYLYIRNIYSPVDFIPYRKYLRRAFDLSLRVYGKPPAQVIDQKFKEDIADVLFRSGIYSDVLDWSSDEYKLARAYFASADYKKAVELSEKLLPKEREYERREKLTYIALVSYARLDNRKMFENLALEYIKNYSKERYAGDLAIKLGVEKFLDGATDSAVSLISNALASPFEDIRERARFLLRYTFGHNIKSDPKGFLFLIKKYKDGLSFLRVDKTYTFVEQKIPSKFAWELYFLKIYLADSALYPLTSLIISNSNLNRDDALFLSQRGFSNLLPFKGDFRSVLAVWTPPPISFYDELDSASQKFSVPLPLLKSIALIESNFNPVAVSPAKAIGLMQIIPTTGKEIFSDLGVPFSVDLLFDPEINAKAGAYYLQKLKNVFGSWALAIAAYNAGPGAVSSWIKKYGKVYCELPEIFIENIPYRQTRFYVMRALSYYLEYSKVFGYEINLDEIFRCSYGRSYSEPKAIEIIGEY